MKTMFAKNPAYLGLALLLVILATGVWLVFAYVASEEERDIQTWQNQLTILADHRKDAVADWVDRQFSALNTLASNGSLQLYATELASRPAASGQDFNDAQHAYLRNLLLATAAREGFNNNGEAAIPANVSAPALSGLALVAPAGNTLVSTSNMPPLAPQTRLQLAEVLKTGKPAFDDIHPGAQGQATVAFLIPVMPIQSSGQQATPIAVIVGVKPAAPVFDMLTRTESAYQTEEALLVRREGSSVVYVSPMGPGAKPLARRLALNTPNLAAAFAIAHPGTFAAKVDYKGTPVLMTSRSIARTPWVLVEKIDRNEALRESRSHQRYLLTSLLLAIFFVGATLVAAWRHGTSVKERNAAEALRQKSRELEEQSALLRAVTDNIADFVYIVDRQGKFVFANRTIADACGVSASDFIGKSLAAVFGPAAAAAVSRMTAPAATGRQAQTAVERYEICNRPARIYHTTAVPVTVPGYGECALLVAHDITEIREAQAKREELMQQVMKTLMRVVDLHDPFCANHSSRNAQVALAIGKELNLDAAQIEALAMAANLANVGKLFVPREILTKIEPLTAEEQEILKQHAQHSEDILAGLKFDGPVLETIAQKNECMDGSGYPKGLKAEEILPSSRILAVANAFVAMVSARAYRKGMSIEEALDQLLKDSKTKYDRQVVAALFNVAENHPDWIAWRDPAPFPSSSQG